MMSNAVLKNWFSIVIIVILSTTIVLLNCFNAHAVQGEDKGAKSLDEETRLHENAGNYSVAIKTAEKAFQRKQKTESDNPFTLFREARSLGDLCVKGNDLEKARRYYSMALYIMNNAGNGDNAEVVSCYNKLGKVQKRLGELDAALGSYKQSSTIIEKAYSSDDIRAGDVSYEVGIIYFLKQDYEKALVHLEKSYAIYRAQYGPLHKSTISSLRWVADVCKSTKDYDKAEAKYIEALANAQQGYGEQSILVGYMYNQLGNLYRHRGKYEVARSYYEKSLFIKEQILTPGDVDFGSAYNNLGLVYHDLRDYSKSKMYFERALPIHETKLDQNSLEKAIFYVNFADLYRDTKEYNKAYSWYQKALSLRAKVLGKEHPSTKEVAQKIISLAQFTKQSPPDNKELCEILKQQVANPADRNKAATSDNKLIAGQQTGSFPFGKQLTQTETNISWTIVINKISEGEYEVTGTIYPHIAPEDVKSWRSMRQFLLLFNNSELVEKIYVKASQTASKTLKLQQTFKTDKYFNKVYLKVGGTIYFSL